MNKRGGWAFSKLNPGGKAHFFKPTNPVSADREPRFKSGCGRMFVAGRNLRTPSYQGWRHRVLTRCSHCRSYIRNRPWLRKVPRHV